MLEITPECGQRLLFPLPFEPGDMTIAKNGSFFIIDPSTQRIVHLDATGAELVSWTLPFSTPPLFVASEGDNVLVASRQSLFKYDGFGSLLTTWADVTDFTSISGIAVNALGDVYVCDAGTK